MPQRQHAIETQAMTRLRTAGLPHWPRDRPQAERIERNGSRRSQKSQVAEAWRQLEIAHRQISLDAFLRDQPRNGGFFIAELIAELEIDRLAAGKAPSVRDFFERCVVHAAPLLHEAAKPRIGILHQ